MLTHESRSMAKNYVIVKFGAILVSRLITMSWSADDAIFFYEFIKMIMLSLLAAIY